MGAHAQDRHKRAAKTIGFALTLNSVETWFETAEILAIRLEPEERAALGTAALWSLRPDGAGSPLPPFGDPVDDARSWAQRASPAELRAFCLAAFQAMRPNDRADFLAFARGIGA